ncbi:hypothetical protein ACL03H_13500 [Saccharopolyspora sp. MS10]|uniref:hypothetical protein n=1 Tax=Saccharopolyspora sp. MS10 TaxID=3385973 RepID=UPI00399EF506
MSRTPPPHDAPERSEVLASWICAQLVNHAPEGWRRIDFSAAMTTSARDIRCAVIMRDGSSPAIEVPEGLVPALADLRREMYEPGRGTWLSLRYMIDPPDEFFAVYNRNLDPMWDPPLPAEAFAEDLEEFPRLDENIPQWLKEITEGK